MKLLPVLVLAAALLFSVSVQAQTVPNRYLDTVFSTGTQVSDTEPKLNFNVGSLGVDDSAPIVKAIVVELVKQLKDIKGLTVSESQINKSDPDAIALRFVGTVDKRDSEYNLVGMVITIHRKDSIRLIYLTMGILRVGPKSDVEALAANLLEMTIEYYNEYVRSLSEDN